MKFELDTLRPFVPLLEPEIDIRPTVTACRKRIREETDTLIHDALLCSNLPRLATHSADVMCGVAATLLQLRLEPEVEDFVYAAKELIEDARKVVDLGLSQRHDKDVKIGCVMLELVARGICATMSIPYEAVFLEVHRANTTPDGVPDVGQFMPTGEPAIDWRDLYIRYFAQDLPQCPHAPRITEAEYQALDAANLEAFERYVPKPPAAPTLSLVK